MNPEQTAILQTIILLLDKEKESDILLKYDLAPYLNEAKEIVKLIENG